MTLHRVSLWQRLASCLLLCLAAGASASTATPSAFDLAKPVPAGGTGMGVPDGKPGVAGSPTDYRVGAQDLLEISVFQVTDLNRTVRVNTSGDISLPLIGTVHAGGRTVDEVEQDISDKLTKTYLQDPQVSVFVKEFTSQRVTMEGAFNKPGIYPLTGQTSLLQAIAMAQGLTELAEAKGVIVFRMIDGRKQTAVFDLGQIRKGLAEDPMIYGDDIVVVTPSASRSFFKRIFSAMPAFGLFF